MNGRTALAPGPSARPRTVLPKSMSTVMTVWVSIRPMCGNTLQILRLWRLKQAMEESDREERRKIENACHGSCQHFLHDIAAHAGKPLVETLIQIGELGVIQAHEVQDSGMKVGDMTGVFDSLKA
jgi:hypothetical protein